MENDNYKWDWMDSRLTQCSESLQEIKGRASIVRAEIKLDYFKQVEQLEQQYHKFKALYKYFQDVSDDERDNLQETVENAWNELEQSFETVIKKYKS